MKFTKQLLSKAWEIFKKICPNLHKDSAWRAYMSHAYKVAFKWLKSLVKGQITFWKLRTEEVQTRDVIPVDAIDYYKKTDREMPKGMFIFIDKFKYLAGDLNPFISINQFQLL